MGNSFLPPRTNWPRQQRGFVTIVLVLLLTTAALAQTPADAPLLDWSHTQQVYQLAEDWTAAGQVDTTRPHVPLWVTDASGVCITLRWLGVNVGTGAVLAPPTTAPKGLVVDLVQLTQQATQQALVNTQLTLEDVNRRRASASQPAAKMLAEVGPLLTVDLQIARTPEPILLTSDAGRDAIYRQFAPDYHGLRLTRTSPDGQNQSVWVWPASALAENLSPQSQLTQLLAAFHLQLNKDLPLVSRLQRSDSPDKMPPLRLARFTVIHMIRPAVGQTPRQLVRGHVLLPPTTVTGQTLENMARQFSDYLLRRRRDNGAMAGTYHPAGDCFDPLTAPAQDTALACYALTCRINYLANTAPTAASLAPLKEGVQRTVDYLLREVPPDQAGQINLPTAALLVLTLTDAPHLADYKTNRDQLAARILALQHDDGLFHSVPRAVKPGASAPDSSFTPPTTAPTSEPPTNAAAPVNLPTQALSVAALADLYQETRDPNLLIAIQKNLDAIWGKYPLPQLPNALPWLSQAQLVLHRLNPPTDKTSKDKWAAQSAALAALAQALRAKQIDSPPNIGPADVVGGFDFTSDSVDVPPNPDWRSAQFLMFLASLLPEPTLVPSEDRLHWLIQCGLGARFIDQLAFDAPGCFFVRSPDDALGGVRLSLWDNRIGLAPTAMSLLAVTELQHALTVLARPER